MDKFQHAALTAQVVSSYLARNEARIEDLASLIATVADSLGKVGEVPQPEAPPVEPAVPVKQSVKPDHLVCLECGAKMSMLRRHLHAVHGLTPLDYRRKWGLPADYPIVAPEYAARRSDLAKASGLGKRK